MDNAATPDETRTSLTRLACCAQRGDRGAFEKLIARLEPGLMRVLLRRCGGQRELVEELVQKTWVAAWQALHESRYDPEKAAFSTFVYAISHKLWLQHLRQRGVQAGSDAGSRLAELLADADDLSATLHASELLDALRACLHSTNMRFSLSEEECFVVIRLCGGETERSLAAELGVVASTVHTRKQQAYKKLRDCLRAKGFVSDGAERPPPGSE